MNSSENRDILIFAGNGASTIPARIGTIRSGAFCGDNYSSPIKIPPSVTTIEPLAFDPACNVIIYSDATERPVGWATDWSNSNTSIAWDYSNTLCEHGEDAYGGWVRSLETEPTCTQFGTMKRYCKYCNSAQIATINPLGHDYQTIDEVAPTCTTAGHITYECTRRDCSDSDRGHTYTEEIPALGHKWGEWHSVIPSICGQFGVNERVCLICGEREQQDSTDPGHVWSSENIIIEPTCSTEGLAHKVCGECGTEVDEPIEKTPHTWGDWDIILPVTCTTDGVRRKICSSCSETIEEPIQAIGHRWSNNNKEVLQPTCTTQGYTTYYCINCGFARQAAYKEALGHTEVIDNAVAATCTTSGKTAGKHCSVCGEVLVAQTVIEALGHKEVIDPAVPATCTTSGMTAGSHCSVCNNIIIPQSMIPAIGHIRDNWITTEEPTTTAVGTRQEVCPSCGTVLATETVPKRLLPPDSGSSVTVYDSTSDEVILNAYAKNTNDVDVRCYATVFDYYGTAVASKEFEVQAKKNASINFAISSLEGGSYRMYFAANGYSDSTAITGTIS